MLALHRPFIANYVHNNHEESQELCLEYGSATQVYLVPIAQQEEQVLLTPTQIRSQGSRLSCVPSDHMASQVTLPRDLHGSVDFSKYPFRVARQGRCWSYGVHVWFDLYLEFNKQA